MSRQEPVRYEVITLAGGLDQVTPTLSLPPGVLRDSINVEASITGGYGRIKGYERFDGRPAPSAAEAEGYILSSVTGLAAGNAVTIGATTAVCTSVSPATMAVFLTKVSGAVTIGATLMVGASPIGTIVSGTGGLQPEALAIQKGLAANVYRADITALPGSGPVRGVAYLDGVTYGWRDNALATALVMHRSTSAGWVAVTMPHEVSFITGGTTEITDGATVNGATSGATAVVQRVMLTSGSWAAGTAAGRLVLATPAGTFSAAENIRIGATIVASSTSISAQVTLAPGGRVRTKTGNFVGGQSARLYGSDGVNRAFEWDGTVYAPISTGNTIDAPNNVWVHKRHLFLVFGSSIQHSVVAQPYQWSAVLGAGEFVLDDNLTGFLSLPGSQDGGALLLTTRNTSEVLYGSGSSTWQLTPYTDTSGALQDTPQRLEQAYCLDDRGVVQLAQSQNYGNFDASTLTLMIRRFVQERRNLVKASGVNREKSQYRLFYSDGYGLYLTVSNGKFLGALPVLFPNPVECWCEGESPDGNQTSFFGSTNGMVYKLDSGTSFDGAEIGWSMATNFGFGKAARIRKRYRHASVEITGESYASFSFGYSLSYGAGDAPESTIETSQIGLSKTSWDTFFWDDFIWDGRTLIPAEISLTGTGENIAFSLYGSSAIQDEFTINSMIVHYTFRRGMR